MKRNMPCLGLAAFFAIVNVSGAATNEATRFVSADLRQTNGPTGTMEFFRVLIR